jgi:hypothetical protein
LDLICAEGSTIPPYILHLSMSDGIQSEILRLPLLSNLETLSIEEVNMGRACLSQDAKKRLAVMLQNLTSLDLLHFTVRNCFSLYPRFVSSAILEQF